MKILDFLFRSKFTSIVSICFYTFVLFSYLVLLFVMNALLVVVTVDTIRTVSFYEGITVLILTLLTMWFLNRMFPAVLGFKLMLNDVKCHILLLFKKGLVKE